MLSVGVGLIVFGGYLLLLTVSRSIQSEDDFRESQQREREIAEKVGWGSGLMTAPERGSRAAYRNPAMRRPFQFCVAVGAILVLVDILNG